MNLNERNFDEPLGNLSQNSSPSFKSNTSLNTPDRMVTFYTGLSILFAMRQQLGLEAMLEYCEQYLLAVEKENPAIKESMQHALSLVSIEKIYRDVIRDS
ncbi:MAG: hypothetical protein KAJ18_03010 [Candidatus Omnitrophica bacterium]|nr:hypothetical protein [Candidatus Omnitrophota bacterium]